MTDPRITKLAHSLINYSVSLKKGEKLLIHMNGLGSEALVKALIKEAYKVGGLPFVQEHHERVQTALLREMSTTQMDLLAENDRAFMKKMDAYIGIGAPENLCQSGMVSARQQSLYSSHYFSKVHGDVRIKQTKWVVLRYPTNAMAQSASMSLEEFEEFYFDVCNLDYKKMSQAMDPLVSLMEKTNKVHIKGKGTDLSFSIKDIPVIKCDGQMNIPDGEIYTAPIKDSVNGVISYNCPAVYQGKTFENIRFEFKNGKIIKASANLNNEINTILDTDEGARFIGEFAIGVHPFIVNPMKNTLFDEKIRGSIHFTPGRCYDQASNGNNSAIHWDLVLIQTPEYGGGEIFFDDILIRKDGRFTHPDLQELNPESL